MGQGYLTKIGFFSLITGGNIMLMVGGLAVSKSF